MKLHAPARARIVADPRPSSVVARELGVSNSRVRQIRLEVYEPGAWGTGGRQVDQTGEANPGAKLTWPAVDWLRDQASRFGRDHYTLRDELEERYGISVTRQAVSDAIAGRTWGEPS